MEYLTIKEFCELKKASRQTVYQQFKSKRIKPEKLFGKLLIPKTAENLAWLPGTGNGRPRKKIKEAP